MLGRRDILKGSAGYILGAGALRTGLAAGGRHGGPQPSRPATGPLRVSSRNPRYFADQDGREVYLCGSHMWNNLVDIGPGDPPPAFDFGAYLDFLDRYRHNFIRLWTWEEVAWDTRANGKWGKKRPHTVAPHPWARTGPGTALDGKPKFDLTRFDDAYFTRLRERVAEAGRRGIYVSAMLFEGWAMQRMEGAWPSHPFHPKNNINGVDGDRNGDGRGFEIHTLSLPEITALQEAYVKKVVETVGDLDNVLYEISNENHPASTRWQYHMIRLIRKIESKRAKQHPVGMTFQFKGGDNKTLFDSPADWISPNRDGGYVSDPPANDGRKVILTDTDHLWGIGGTLDWVWKSFTRGLNPIFMDPYDGMVLGPRFAPKWDPVRRGMGQTRRLADDIGLGSMTPHGELASTGYCLADPGRQYVVYAPKGVEIKVDLSHASGAMSVTWIDARTGKRTGGGSVEPGRRALAPPKTGKWALWIRRPPS